MAGSKDPAGDVGRLVIRLAAGLGLAWHGYGKVFGADEHGVRNISKFIQSVGEMGIPYPRYLGWAAALSEFAGGIMLAVGLGARFAAFMISCTMLVALFKMRTQAWPKQELALLYLSPALFSLVAGPGRFSLDARFFKRK